MNANELRNLELNTQLDAQAYDLSLVPSELFEELGIQNDGNTASQFVAANKQIALLGKELNKKRFLTRKPKLDAATFAEYSALLELYKVVRKELIKELRNDKDKAKTE